MQKNVIFCIFYALSFFRLHHLPGCCSGQCVRIPPPSTLDWSGPLDYIRDAFNYACGESSGYNLSGADCMVVLRFLVVNFAAGGRQFTFSVPLSGLERPVTPWLKAPPLSADTSKHRPSTPNTCVSNVLSHPPLEGQYIETVNIRIPELLQEDQTESTNLIDDQKTFRVDEKKLKDVCREIGAEHHYSSVVQKAKEIANGGSEHVLEVRIDHVIRLPVYVDGSLHQLTLRPSENPFVVAKRFCDKFTFSEKDCDALTTEALNLFAVSLQSRILKCKGVSVHFGHETNSMFTRDPLSFHLWSLPSTWASDQIGFGGEGLEILHPSTGSIFFIEGDNDVFNGIKVKLQSKADSVPVLKIVRIAINNHPLYLHDCTLNSSLVDMDLSFLKIGTWLLQAQVGLYQVFNARTREFTIVWGPVTESVFEITPSVLYHPDLQRTVAAGVEEQEQVRAGLVTHATQQGEKNRPIQVIHVSSIGGLDGQSRVLVNAALNYDPEMVKVTFMTTKKTVPPADILKQLDEKDIDYLYIPLVIPRDIYHGIFNSSLDPFIQMVSSAKSVFDIENEQVREIIDDMVAMMRGADIVTFTNIAARIAEDTILAQAARLAHVPIILCDPGNIERQQLPTVHGVTGLIVPSYRAKQHWKLMGVKLPIHVVWPGAAVDSRYLESAVKRKEVISIVWTGRLHGNKSPGIFVHAAAALAKLLGDRINFLFLAKVFFVPP